MAVSGGATTAYRVSVSNGKAQIKPTTASSIICATPAEAVAAALDGDTVTVAGSDMWALLLAFAARGIEVAS
jgi:hypothetical protein